MAERKDADVAIDTSKIEQAIMRRRSAIARKQEQDELLRIGKTSIKKIRSDREEKAARWSTKANFSIPIAPPGRPKSDDGGVTFHFQLRSVSKTVSPETGASGSRPGYEMSAAVQHAKYIEREHAPETVASKSEERNVQSERETAWTLQANAESPSEEEGRSIGNTIETNQTETLIFSNISNDPFLRNEYWAAVDRTERTPRTHSLRFSPDVPIEIWDHLLAQDSIPGAFKSHIARQFASMKIANEADARCQMDPMSCSLDQASEILQWAQQQSVWSNTSPLFQFESGRGGRTQYRLIAELPHELGSKPNRPLDSGWQR
ncbi:MAG: hypothetical protein DDT26_02269 [Dehalococcoidia bacterium]|nr:hypothetical protein [Chloroflexota bacterium]